MVKVSFVLSGYPVPSLRFGEFLRFHWILSDSDRCLDRWLVFVADEMHGLGLNLVQRRRSLVEKQDSRETCRFSGELFPDLFDVVQVDVEIPEADYQLSRQQPAMASQKHVQERIRRDVEREPEERIDAPGIQVKIQFTLPSNVALPECVARR